MCISDYSNISATQRGQSDSLENASKFDELWLRTQQIAKILEAKVPFGKKGSVVEHAMPGSTTAKPVGLTSTTDADVSVKLQPLDPSAHDALTRSGPRIASWPIG